MKKLFCTFSVLILCIIFFNASSYAGPSIYISRLDACPINVSMGIEKGKRVLNKIGATSIDVVQNAVFGHYPDYSVGIIPVRITEECCSLIFLVTGIDINECEKINKEMRSMWIEE